MEEAPKESVGSQVAKAAATGAAGMIPVLGSPIAAMLAMWLGVQHSRRMEAWYADVTEAIEDLQEHVAEPLEADPEFLDAVVAATRVVESTSHQDKVDALRNAVMNSLLPDAPDDDLQHRFIRIIGEMTPTHMLLLRFLNDPSGWYEQHPEIGRHDFVMGSRFTVLRPAFPTKTESTLERLAEDLAT